MQKLLCIPCNETPNVRVKMKCVCCGSKTISIRRAKRPDSEENSKNGDSEEQGCANCGCANFIKRSSRTRRKEQVTEL